MILEWSEEFRVVRRQQGLRWGMVGGHTEEILGKGFVCFAKQFDFILKVVRSWNDSWGGRHMAWSDSPFLKLCPSGMWKMGQWQSQVGGRDVSEEAFVIFHIRNEGKSGLGQFGRGLNPVIRTLGRLWIWQWRSRWPLKEKSEGKDAPQVAPKFLSQTGGSRR